MRPKSVDGYIPLQRISSFETLANGFNHNVSAKVGTVLGTNKPRGYRRESVATQAAQQVLDEVFRSSIRGSRGVNVMYGTVRPTIKPRTADWIREIPTPMLRSRNTMSHPQQAPPCLSMSVPPDAEPSRPNIPRENVVPRPRRVSLAPTVLESDEDTSETTVDKRGFARVAAEDADGDDEFDVANAILEDDDISDRDIRSRRTPRPEPAPSAGRGVRLSPIRRNSSRPGKQLSKGRYDRLGSDRKNLRRLDATEIDTKLLFAKIVQLQKSVEGISERLHVNKTQKSY